MPTQVKMTEPNFSPPVQLASALLGAGVAPEPPPKRRKYTVTDKETRGQHLKKHQWKKGQSGHPQGRPPKNLSLVSLIKERLENYPEDAKSIALAVISLAKGKDMRAIEELLNRIDGKVREVHKFEGEMPVQILFVPAAQILTREKGQIIEGEARELRDGK